MRFTSPNIVYLFEPAARNDASRVVSYHRVPIRDFVSSAGDAPASLVAKYSQS